MKTIILVCGPAGIGKSTFCKKTIEDNHIQNAFILAADEVRKDLCGSYTAFPKNHNMMVIYREMVRRARKLAKENEDLTLFMDTTMLYDERRLFFIRNLPEYTNKILVLLKLHDYKICLERNKKRIKEKWVPDNVIADMAKRYVDPTEETKAFFNEVKEFYLD